MKKIISVVILANEIHDNHNIWIKACKDVPGINYRVVDLLRNNWLEEIQKEPFDFLLAKPGAFFAHYKQLYDERVLILHKCLGYKVFPSVEEISLYENKRLLSFWLKANKLPHPKTDVFYELSEALDFIDNTTFPIVGKVNIGASGSGVTIIKNKKEAKEYLIRAFSEKGVPQRIGPNIEKGNLLIRAGRLMLKPKKLIEKVLLYRRKARNTQQNFILFQEYIPHNYEWRAVRIGDSFFAHKKIVKGEKASGSLIKGYDTPPDLLLNFIKEITDRYNFKSVAIDLFEYEDKFLINEIQCIFGQSDPYQMLIDGKPGRFIYLNDEWVFEEGDFNKNESFNLRLEYLISLKQ